MKQPAAAKLMSTADLGEYLGVPVTRSTAGVRVTKGPARTASASTCATAWPTSKPGLSAGPTRTPQPNGIRTPPCGGGIREPGQRFYIQGSRWHGRHTSNETDQ